MKKLIIFLLSVIINNSAYSDITGKMDCTVKETNNITIDKGFHKVWKYIGIGSLKTDEKFKILYSIKTNQISIELENIYNRYKDIDNLFFYRKNPFYFSIDDPKIYNVERFSDFPVRSEDYGKSHTGYYLENKDKYKIRNKFIITKHNFLTSDFSKYGNETTSRRFQLKKYDDNNWNGYIYLDGSHTKYGNLETILYTITFDCISKKDLSEVSSFIQNNFKWE